MAVRTCQQQSKNNQYLNRYSLATLHVMNFAKRLSHTLDNFTLKRLDIVWQRKQASDALKSFINNRFLTKYQAIHIRF